MSALLTVSIRDIPRVNRQHRIALEAIYREFGRRLRRARRAAELTQEELGKRVRLSRTSITNIEQGNQHVGLHLLYALAKAVGVAPSGLLPEEVESGLSLDRMLKGVRGAQRHKLKSEMGRLSEADQVRMLRLIGKEEAQDDEG
jgi:transcriptional regulator with XRE-family HTH domain